MFKKLITTGILATGLICSVGLSEAGAAMSVTPTKQTIIGGTQYAEWTLTWSGGQKPWSVHFASDTNASYKTINASTTYLTMKHRHQYNLASGYKYYYPKFRVTDYNGASSATSAEVYQKLY
ncbi:hypothetical protein ACQKCU_20645 [Heyndrickxia sporothermodurans]